MRIEDIWWKRLSNPVNLIESVVDILLDNRSVVVVFDDDLPWRETFMEAISEEVEVYSSEMRTKHHSLADHQDPGDFLLKHYCSAEVQREYWPPDSKAGFLANRPQVSLNKSYVFVDLKGDSSKWVSFIKEYTSYFEEGVPHGLFVLFTTDRKFLESGKKKGEDDESASSPIQFLDYTEFIHDYDTYLLCMTLLSQKKLSMLQQQYLSEIVVALSGNNVALAGALADSGEVLAEHTQQVTDQVLRELNLSQKALHLDIGQALWQAQLKILFPILEKFRQNFISVYKKEVDALFYAPHPSLKFDCETSEELEIGQLYLLFVNTRILPFHDYDLLHSARLARNHLAHLEALPYQELKSLFTISIKGKD